MTNTTNVPSPVFTPTGLVIPLESAILAGVQQDYNAAFGGNLNPALNTPQGQLTSSTAAMVANANTVFATFVNQVDPDTATGFMQDAIGRIYFLTRNPAVSTSVNCQCVGVFGTEIPVGSLVQDTSGNIYACTQAGEIPIGGTITLPFANTVAGPTPCPANTVTQIYQAVNGWESVNNSSPGTTGAAVESPQAFEYRRKQSVGLNSQGSLPAVYAACFNVPGVIDVFVTQNSTGAVVTGEIAGNPNSTSFPVAPNSLYVAVVGGAAEAVCQAIWKATNVGCAFQPSFSGTGSQTGTVVTISATDNSISPNYIVPGMTLTGAVEGGSVTVTSYGTYTIAAGTGTVNVSASGSVSSGAIAGAQQGPAGASLVSEQVQDLSGYANPIPVYTVNYINPVDTPIYFAVSLENSTVLPSNIVTLVQQAIIGQFTGTNGNLRARCGALILASQYYGVVAAIGSEVQILSIEIGFSASPADNSLQMGIDQEPTIVAGNISVSIS
jgi:hypothetical protein